MRQFLTHLHDDPLCASHAGLEVCDSSGLPRMEMAWASWTVSFGAIVVGQVQKAVAAEEKFAGHFACMC